MLQPLGVAVVQPASVIGDVSANARAHARSVRDAGSRLVVFPELSLTGYVLDADPVGLGDDAWSPIVEACASASAVALVGAPVLDAVGDRHIAVVAVTQDGVEIAYRKIYLGDAERAWFSPGSDPAVVTVDGWRLGLGICKDTGIPAHVGATTALGVDAYVAGVVVTPEESDEQTARAVSTARQFGVYVAFASFAGPTGGGYGRTAGSSAIWSPTGKVLARAGSQPGDTARALLV